MRLSGLTERHPVDSVLTTSGKIFCISWAITPSCTPSLSIAACDGNVESTSSGFLYSKFLTCIWLILSKQTLLLKIFLFII